MEELNAAYSEGNLEPILDVRGRFITASVLQERIKVRHAREQNQHLMQRIAIEERKVDAAKFLIEAKMGLWNDVPSFAIKKQSWDNEAFHFGPNV